MLLQEVLDFFNGKKNGQYFGITMKTEKKPSAKYKAMVLEKLTSVKNRIGQKYISTSSEMNGDYESLYTTIIPYRLKSKVDKNGEVQYYLEVHTAGSEPKCTYYVNGEVVDKNEFNSYLTPSEVNKKLDNSNAYYIVNIKNIIELR